MLYFFIPALLLALYHPAAPGSGSDCPRSTPAPVLRPVVFPGSRFQLAPDRASATETARLSADEPLTIRHWGCETYGLSFRFDVSRPGAPAANARYWYRQAAALLTRTARGLDAPLHPAQAAAALTRAAQATPAFGQELTYRGTDIRETVVVKAPRPLGAGRYALTIDLAAGPL